MTRSALVRRAARGAALTLVAASVAMAPPVLAQEGPWFTAHVTNDQVFGAGFGGAVTVTVAGPGAETHTYTDGIFYGDGSFELFLDQSSRSDGVDVQPGQTVTVSGPNGTKTLLVADLQITAYDLTANTLAGTVDVATGTVSIWAEHPGAESWTSTQASGGSWGVNFDEVDPPYDLRALDRAGAAFDDEDQDSTMVESTLAPVRFAASVELQEIVGLGWEPGSVSVTIKRTGSPDLGMTVETLPPDQVYGGHLQSAVNGNVYVDLTTGSFRLQPGDVVTMSQGATVKVQAIPALTMGLPDYAGDVVAGTATFPLPAGSFLMVEPDLLDGENYFLPLTPVEDTWSLAVETDLTHDSLPAVVQSDVDGDVTESHAPRPAVYVDPAADRIWAPDFAAGTVTLTVQRGASVVHSESLATTNVLTKGSYNLDMWAQPTGTLARPTMVLHDGFDVLAGDVITVSDGVSSRTITVAALTVGSVNALTDVVAGTAAPDGTDVVTLHLGEGEGGFWGYSADVSAGAWSFWFLDPEFWFINLPDGLVPGMTGQAMIGSTIVRWTVPQPVAFEKSIAAPPSYNMVRAGNAVQLRFRLGGDVGLEIFAAGSPTSQLLPAGTPEPTLTARSGLTYKNGVYTYVWATDSSWRGTSRQLVMTFTDGRTAVAYFTFR